MMHGGACMANNGGSVFLGIFKCYMRFCKLLQAQMICATWVGWKCSKQIMYSYKEIGICWLRCCFLLHTCVQSGTISFNVFTLAAKNDAH
jgi:hypothetical protein